MTSTTLYPTATDHINKHPYTILVPPHVFDIHKDIQQGNLFAPPYEAFDSNIPQRARATISDMVTYVITNTTFTIVNDYDVLVILHQIDAYVEEVFHLRDNKTVATYIERILRLRARIYVLFRRVLNRHPQWKTSYMHEQGIFSFLSQLYGSIGVKADLPQTILDRLSVCPTIAANPDQFTDPTMTVRKTSSKDVTSNKIQYNV